MSLAYTTTSTGILCGAATMIATEADVVVASRSSGGKVTYGLGTIVVSLVTVPGGVSRYRFGLRTI
jgi:hypothetical protein